MIGKESQFAPIRLYWDGSLGVSFWVSSLVEEAVEPFMAADEIAARMVKIKPPSVASMEGCLLSIRKTTLKKYNEKSRTPETSQNKQVQETTKS